MPTLEVGRITRLEFTSDEDGSLWLTIHGSKRPVDVYRFPVSEQQVRDMCEDAEFILEGIDLTGLGESEQQQPEPQEARK
jgi:hypothetical protein